MENSQISAIYKQSIVLIAFTDWSITYFYNKVKLGLVSNWEVDEMHQC